MGGELGVKKNHCLHKKNVNSKNKPEENDPRI